MRTTLTLDEDVAAMLEQLRDAKRTSFKTLVNDALREGLKRLASPTQEAQALSYWICRSRALPVG